MKQHGLFSKRCLKTKCSLKMLVEDTGQCLSKSATEPCTLQFEDCYNAAIVELDRMDIPTSTEQDRRCKLTDLTTGVIRPDPVSKTWVHATKTM